MTLADSEARTSDNLQFKAGDLLVFERPFGPQTISARHYISGRSGIVPIHLVQQQTQRDSDSHQQIPHANQSLYPLISTVENPPSTVLPSSSSADLNQFEWFHGAIGRKEAEARLLHAPNAVDGLYLVRARETGGQEFVLSVLCSRNVEHYRIVLNGSQIVLAEQVDHPFASIPELIRYCSQAVRNSLDSCLGHSIQATTGPSPIVILFSHASLPILTASCKHYKLFCLCTICSPIVFGFLSLAC